MPADVEGAPVEPSPGRGRRRKASQIPMDLETPAGALRHSADGWQLPPIGILKSATPGKGSAVDNARRAQLITDTLASFGVDATVVQVNEGPTVTQFGVEPGWDVKTRTVIQRDASGQPILGEDGQPRVKEIEVSRTRIRVNRITALQNDLALALATPALRIEAPVPGKPMVGIEVPNQTTSLVSLRSVMESTDYAKAFRSGGIPIALGAGVSGDPVVADLATMPHVLIAGATGSGKSVCLNAVITCLLMNFSPEELRMVMIDPKRVELTGFANIPHLAFSEIVVEMDQVVGTLQAVINEMETRYRRFAKAGVRNIKRFNETTTEGKLPYWVVIIDELADLMLVAPYQVENQLVRLAQLARATGIHLVVATQRPSVDVITGLIKANFPTRIAFAVSSMVDSRTILDHGGAEKLLGKGDMLYVPPDAQKPKRVQGAFVADQEIDDLVKFWTSDRFAELVPDKFDELLVEAQREVAEHAESASAPGTDPMFSRAIEVAREHQSVSTSLLQRKLRIGYPRAARLMDELEERGYVGPQESGGGSREVLMAVEAGAGP
ncbi:MAG: DNA translocase FtsK, partial [Dehalococcoidia bacterium]